MAGFGIKVQTDTGRFVWVTETGTHVMSTAKGVLKFDSHDGAGMYRNVLAKNNPQVILVVKKL